MRSAILGNDLKRVACQIGRQTEKKESTKDGNWRHGKGGGVGRVGYTPLDALYRYVPPKNYGFSAVFAINSYWIEFSHFGHNIQYGFCTLQPWIGYVFKKQLPFQPKSFTNYNNSNSTFVWSTKLIIWQVLNRVSKGHVINIASNFWRGQLNRAERSIITDFGHKEGRKGFGKQAAHPYPVFQGVPTPGLKGANQGVCQTGWQVDDKEGVKVGCWTLSNNEKLSVKIKHF